MSLEKNFVVKTGTRVLTHEGFNAHEPDQMDMNVMHQLARDISSISKETEMGAVLVTSGAVGFGDAKKDLKRHTKNPDELVKIKQALAAYGQTRLMNQWGNAFHEAKPSRDVAQFLITHNNLTNPSERDDMLRTMGIVLEQGDVPVVNENDTVANREIRFGDNDQLASQLALSTGAEALIILSEVEGFCDKDPRKFADAQVIARMKASEITAEKIASKDFGGSKGGTGGIISKLGAASDYVKQSGKPAWVAHGKKPGVVSKILRGEQVGTMIVPE